MGEGGKDRKIKRGILKKRIGYFALKQSRAVLKEGRTEKAETKGRRSYERTGDRGQ
jgi:hypothetical protein